MQMVAAAKMRRAQARVQEARPYADGMRAVLATVSARVKEYRHPFLTAPERGDPVLLLVTTDRGLCGALNVNVIRAAHQHMRERYGSRYAVIAVGRKGREFAGRFGLPVLDAITGLPDRPTFAAVQPAAARAMGAFLDGRASSVTLAYAHYRNILRQVPQVVPLLPMVPPEASGPGPSGDYIYEPDAQSVLDRLLPRWVETEVYRAVLENQASEQAAKMVAMRAATNNANDLIRELTLTANKVRQASITRELMEIVGGAEALKAGRS